ATGKAGAATIWQDYRNVFGDLQTTFTHTVVGEDIAALEWTSTGTLRSGRPFEYNGVTIIQGDDERVSGVRTYYDSAAFLQETGGTA
ncbi:MAG: nuclear transport factor 2 family protein, partial [Actinomycetes bacterium]